MKDLVNGFKEFILRGNVLDLAIAVVIGAAFTALVNSMAGGLPELPDPGSVRRQALRGLHLLADRGRCSSLLSRNEPGNAPRPQWSGGFRCSTFASTPQG